MLGHKLYQQLIDQLQVEWCYRDVWQTIAGGERARQRSPKNNYFCQCLSDVDVHSRGIVTEIFYLCMTGLASK